MHPGRSSAKHRRAGKVRQSDARHTRKGQRGGVGVGEGGGSVGKLVALGLGAYPLTAGANGPPHVGHLTVDVPIGIVRCNNRELVDRIIELVMRENRAIVLLAHIVREGLGSATARNISITLLQAVKRVSNRGEAQGLRIVATGSGRDGLDAVVRKVLVIRKLERKLLHLATLNDLSRLRSPGAAGGVRNVLIGEGLSPVGADNRIIALSSICLHGNVLEVSFALGMLDRAHVFDLVVMDFELYGLVRIVPSRNRYEHSRLVFDCHLNLVHDGVVCDAGNTSGIFD